MQTTTALPPKPCRLPVRLDEGQVHLLNCPCGRVLHLERGAVECKNCGLRHVVSVQTFKGAA